MAQHTLLPQAKRLTVTTLVMTPVPGPSDSARIECTRCPAKLVISGFPLSLVRRLVVAVQKEHQCSAKS